MAVYIVKEDAPMVVKDIKPATEQQKKEGIIATGAITFNGSGNGISLRFLVTEHASVNIPLPSRHIRVIIKNRGMRIDAILAAVHAALD